MVSTIPPSSDVPIGGFLRDKRVALGLTQVDLATRLKCSQARVSAVENGTCGLGIDDFAEWAAALNLSAEEKLEAIRRASPA